MRIGSPSNWEERGTQEGAGEKEQVALRRGTVLFREGKGEFDGGIVRAFQGCDRRLDLGLQDAPRSTIYRDQTRRRKGK